MSASAFVCPFHSHYWHMSSVEQKWCMSFGCMGCILVKNVNSIQPDMIFAWNTLMQAVNKLCIVRYCFLLLTVCLSILSNLTSWPATKESNYGQCMDGSVRPSCEPHAVGVLTHTASPSCSLASLRVQSEQQSEPHANCCLCECCDHHSDTLSFK